MWSMWDAPSDRDYYAQFEEPDPEEEPEDPQDNAGMAEVPNVSTEPPDSAECPF